MEDSVFRITVPLSDVATQKVGPEASVTDFGNVSTEASTEVST